MNVVLIYIRHLYPQISTIVILCGIFGSNRSSYKIEKVHKNGLRVTLNDYMSSYSDMLEVIKRPALYISRIKSIANETFKSVKRIKSLAHGIYFLVFNHALLYTLWVQIGSTKSKYD